MSSGETLYNGIQFPSEWPPRNVIISRQLPPPNLGQAYAVDDKREYDHITRKPTPVPWLENPPAVIPIDIGRQLFVDDFLIQDSTLERIFHLPVKDPANPIFLAETELEKPPGRLAGASPKSGGIWWDPAERIYKMWYEAGWLEASAYATSRDGIHWDRPSLDVVPGTNQILPDLIPDSTAVFIDYDTTDLSQRYKMVLRQPGSWEPGRVMTSPDGIHWSEPVSTGLLNDRSTMFYNPFRKKWVYSIRSLSFGRTRHYWEHDDFIQGSQWGPDDPVFWATADDLDLPDPRFGCPAQLYNLDAVAYESLMIGFFEIHRGPANPDCIALGTPKITELVMAYSRDGFHWHRPDRRAFIAASRTEGTWDRGYVQSVGGVCTLSRDEMRFYYSACGGGNKETDPEGGMYANRFTGLARLRRDGFASLRAGNTNASATTRPVAFSGEHLFVNVSAGDGEMTVEILAEDGTPIAPFTRAACNAVHVDSTAHRIQWKAVSGLGDLTGKPVRFRFHLRNAEIYAFWVSSSPDGESAGYMAAGSPDHASFRDVHPPNS